MEKSELYTTYQYSVELAEFFFSYENYYLAMGESLDNTWTVSVPNPDYWYPEIVEFARIKIKEKNYVVIDPNGFIGTEEKKWSRSVIPTRYLHLKFEIPIEVLSNREVRQLVVYKGTVTNDGTFPNVALPQDILEKGKPLWNQNTEPFTALALVDNMVDYILVF